jgi:LytS/YehU family sensor histidine kinase
VVQPVPLPLGHRLHDSGHRPLRPSRYGIPSTRQNPGDCFPRQSKAIQRVPAILVFGLLAILGTHSGIPIDIHQGLRAIDLSAEMPEILGATQAIAGFRDTMALVAGLIGGPWVGLGAGLLAGAERYQLGGFAALASGLASVILGVFAGGIRCLRPHWVTTVTGVFWVAITGTLLHRLLILILVRPYNDALALSWEVVVPVGICQ